MQTVCLCCLGPGFQGSLRPLPEIAGKSEKRLERAEGHQVTCRGIGDTGRGLKQLGLSLENNNKPVSSISQKPQKGEILPGSPKFMCLLLQSKPIFDPFNSMVWPLDQSFHRVFKFIHRDFATLFQIFLLFSLWTSLLLLAMCAGTSPGDLSVNLPKKSKFATSCAV